MKKFLLFLVTIIVVIGLTACSSDATTSDEASNSGSTVDNSKKSYGLNEDVYITNSDGEYRLKITGITETSERNQFSDTVADRVIIISYEYENISLSSDLYVASYDFSVYDADNNVLSTYPADVDYPSSVGVGRKGTASIAYALNNNNNYIEVEYYDNMFNSTSDCIFKISW